MKIVNFATAANGSEATQVLIRRIWLNENSEKNQATIQFYQKKASGVTGPGGLVSVFQNAPGLTSSVTCIQSVNIEIRLHIHIRHFNVRY